MEEVIVVSTNESLTGYKFHQSNVTLIVRPNLGYDFYSYKVGLSKLVASKKAGNVFFINSSFLVTNPIKFEESLISASKLLEDSDLVGITKSNQFSTHVQSYFFGINAKSLETQWLKDWFASIEPRNSKTEVIFMYELGLSAMFLAHNQKVSTLWNPSVSRKFLSCIAYSKQLIKTKSVLFWLTHIGELTRYNPVQIEAKLLSENFGLIKNEILMENPLGISTDFLGSMKLELSSQVDSLDFSPPKWKSSSVVHLAHFFPSRAELIVTLHVHYIEVLDELYAALDNIPVPYDLWVTTSTPSHVKQIFNKFKFVANGLKV
jgi:rhamnosyltransferase